MRIIRGDSNRIDFSVPIQATPEQEERFIAFLKGIYEPSVVFTTLPLDEDDPGRNKRLGEQPRPTYPKWSQEEYIKLLDFEAEDEYQLAEQIGRTPTAIYMRRGVWVASFMNWAEGRNIYENTPELVREFMVFLEQQRRQRGEERRAVRAEAKRKRMEIERLEKRIHSLEMTIQIQTDMFNRLHDERWLSAIAQSRLDIEKAQSNLDLLRSQDTE